MKLTILLSCFVLCGIWGIQALAEENIFEFFEKPSEPSISTMGFSNDGGKNIKCWECATNATICSTKNISLCSDDFNNTTLLTQCTPEASFCVNVTVKEGKNVACTMVLVNIILYCM